MNVRTGIQQTLEHGLVETGVMIGGVVAGHLYTRARQTGSTSAARSKDRLNGPRSFRTVMSE